MPMEDHNADPLSLADAIALMREEVLRAQTPAGGSSAMFMLEEVTIELSAELVRSRSGSAGLRWVVAAEGKAEESARATHRVAVKLKPIVDIEVSDPDVD